MGFITDLLKDIPLSAVLKERLAIAEKEMSSLRDQIVNLTTENASLRQKIGYLESEKFNLVETIHQLRGQKNTISDLEHNILKLFNEYLKISLDTVSHKLSLDEIKSEYFLNELLKKKLLTIQYEKEPHRRKPVALYLPTQAGREYMIKNKII